MEKVWSIAVPTDIVSNCILLFFSCVTRVCMRIAIYTSYAHIMSTADYSMTSIYIYQEALNKKSAAFCSIILK